MILPHPPHRLNPRYVARQRRGALVIGGAGALLLFLCVGMGPAEVRGIRRDAAIWIAGDSAPVLDLRGLGTTSGTYRLFWINRLAVRYQDSGGVMHRGVAQFTTLSAFADTQTTPYVRYLSATPDSFALSWAHRAIPNRWKALTILLLASAGCGGLLLAVAYRVPIRQLRALAACASGPYAELTLDVVGVPQPQGRGLVRYKLEGRGPSGRSYRCTCVGDPAFGQPLFLDPARRTVLALAADAYPATPVVVRDTLAPFVFPEPDRQRLIANLGARGA